NFHSLAVQIGRKQTHASYVATRMCESPRETRPHHVLGDADNGKRAHCFLCNTDTRIAASIDNIDIGTRDDVGVPGKVVGTQTMAAGCDHQIAPLDKSCTA